MKVAPLSKKKKTFKQNNNLSKKNQPFLKKNISKKNNLLEEKTTF